MGKIFKNKKDRRDVSKIATDLERVAQDLKNTEGKRVSPLKDAVQSKQVANLSRGQRKRFAKKVQFARKQQIVTSSQEKATKIREGTLGNLSSLSVNLPAAASNPNSLKRSMKMTSKNRQKITNIEIAQFQAVLAHPAFQANPLATIQDHLENSIRAATKS